MKETANLPDTQIGTVARAAAHPQPLFSRILAPTDFSHRSKAAVDY